MGGCAVEGGEVLRRETVAETYPTVSLALLEVSLGNMDNGIFAKF